MITELNMQELIKKCTSHAGTIYKETQKNRTFKSRIYRNLCRQ